MKTNFIIKANCDNWDINCTHTCILLSDLLLSSLYTGWLRYERKFCNSCFWICWSLQSKHGYFINYGCIMIITFNFTFLFYQYQFGILDMWYTNLLSRLCNLNLYSYGIICPSLKNLTILKVEMGLLRGLRSYS